MHMSEHSGPIIEIGLNFVQQLPGRPFHLVKIPAVSESARYETRAVRWSSIRIGIGLKQGEWHQAASWSWGLEPTMSILLPLLMSMSTHHVRRLATYWYVQIVLIRTNNSDNRMIQDDSCLAVVRFPNCLSGLGNLTSLAVAKHLV